MQGKSPTAVNCWEASISRTKKAPCRQGPQAPRGPKRKPWRHPSSAPEENIFGLVGRGSASSSFFKAPRRSAVPRSLSPWSAWIGGAHAGTPPVAPLPRLQRFSYLGGVPAPSYRQTAISPLDGCLPPALRSFGFAGSFLSQKPPR